MEPKRRKDVDRVDLINQMGFFTCYDGTKRVEHVEQLCGQIKKYYVNNTSEADIYTRAKCSKCQSLTRFIHLFLCEPVCSSCVNDFDEFSLCSYDFCTQYMHCTAGDLQHFKQLRASTQYSFGNPRSTPETVYLFSDVKKLIEANGSNMKKIHMLNFMLEANGTVFKIGIESTRASTKGVCRPDIALFNAKSVLTGVEHLLGASTISRGIYLDSLVKYGGLRRNKLEALGEHSLIPNEWLQLVKNTRGDTPQDRKELQNVVFSGNMALKVSLGGDSRTRANWASSNVESAPVGRPLKLFMECDMCKLPKGVDGFSKNSWHYNITAFCRDCYEAERRARPNQQHNCQQCKTNKLKCEYDKSNWKNKSRGNAVCMVCKAMDMAISCKNCGRIGTRNVFSKYEWHNRFKLMGGATCQSCNNFGLAEMQIDVANSSSSEGEDQSSERRFIFEQEHGEESDSDEKCVYLQSALYVPAEETDSDAE